MSLLSTSDQSNHTWLLMAQATRREQRNGDTGVPVFMCPFESVCRWQVGQECLTQFSAFGSLKTCWDHNMPSVDIAPTIFKALWFRPPGVCRFCAICLQTSTSFFPEACSDPLCSFLLFLEESWHISSISLQGSWRKFFCTKYWPW